MTKKNIHNYKGTWYINEESIDYKNPTKLDIVDINNNKMTFNLYISRICDFDNVQVIIKNNKGNFEAVSENAPSTDGSQSIIKGSIKLKDNTIGIEINESNLLYIEAGSIYEFEYKKDNAYDDIKTVLQKYPISRCDTLRLKSVKENGDNYIVTLDYYVATRINETEYQKMVSDGEITIDGDEYYFKKEAGDGILADIGYGYIEMKNRVDNKPYGYIVEKRDDQYVFLWKVGGSHVYINSVKGTLTAAMSKDTEISVATANDGDYTLETYAERLTDEMLKSNIVTVEQNESGKIYVHVDVR